MKRLNNNSYFLFLEIKKWEYEEEDENLFIPTLLSSFVQFWIQFSLRQPYARIEIMKLLCIISCTWRIFTKSIIFKLNI